MRVYLKRAAFCVVSFFILSGIALMHITTYYQHWEPLDQHKIVKPEKKEQHAPHVHSKPKATKPLSHEEMAHVAVGKDEFNPRGQVEGRSDDDDGLNLNKYFRLSRQKKAEILALNKLFANNAYPSKDQCTRRMTLEQFWLDKYRSQLPKNDPWERFYAQINTCDLYEENGQAVEELLKSISTLPIKHIANLDSGTQVKFVITFNNGKKALFKPMRFSRAFETHPDQFYFTDFERHNAEIAAFHLDRLLGFRRAVPTVGRVVNITSEFLVNAEKSLARTFFYSPAKNLCFVGKCDYYCDTTHAVCGHPDMIEGSFQVFLPDDEQVPRDHVRSLYKRTYSKRTQQALWQKDQNYCNWKVKYTPPYSNGQALLNLVDLYILDFLMGNQDRHHYETFTVFDQPVYFLHLDNGRGFGKTKEDDMDIVAPLSQCCIIRPSTLRTLLKFYSGPISLGQAFKKSLSKDPVAPILADKHFPSMDRRLELILLEVEKCLQKAGGSAKKILINTFYNPDAPLTIDEDEEEDD